MASVSEAVFEKDHFSIQAYQTAAAATEVFA